MALTNLTTTNNVVQFFPATPNNPSDAGGLFRLANDGNVKACNAVAGNSGADNGPDFVFTGNTAGAETVNFSVTFATLLKLYAAQISGTTRLAIKAKVHSRSAAVATSDYWEVLQVFDDIAGTMTAIGTQAVGMSIEGAATTDPALTNSGSNTLQVAVTSLAAAAVRVELFVQHVQ
jgi:hypothetical protein